jgi:DNA polymerase-1
MILLVDGLNSFFRYYCANPTMTQNGDPAGGVAGFLGMLAKLSEQFSPSEIHVVWEGGGSLRRRAIFPGYKKGKKPQKMNRYYDDEIPDSDQNRLSQVAFLTKCLRQLPVRQHYVKDCEADDVIGYLARYKFKDSQVMIISSDRDFYQLIDDRVRVWSPGQKKIIEKSDVLEKMHALPSNMPTVRACVGDSSDSIDGVKGVGLKSLSNRIEILRSVENVSLDDLFRECQSKAATSKARIYENILENKDLIRRNFRLMCLDVSNLAGDQIQKIEGSLEIYEKNYNKIAFLSCLKKFGLVNYDPARLFLSMNILNRR